MGRGTESSRFPFSMKKSPAGPGSFFFGVQEVVWSLGNQSRALGNRSHALGNRSRALGNRSRALGNRSRALGNRSRARRGIVHGAKRGPALLKHARPPGRCTRRHRSLPWSRHSGSGTATGCVAGTHHTVSELVGQGLVSPLMCTPWRRQHLRPERRDTAAVRGGDDPWHVAVRTTGQRHSCSGRR
jgi:hypothetical protein